VRHIVAFTSFERETLERSRALLQPSHADFAQIIEIRIQDLEQLGTIVDRSAALTVDLGFSKEGRNLETLAAKLTNQGIEEVVNLPVKASLGRSFTVSKLHLFGFLLKLSQQGHLITIYQDILDCYHTILFSLMAEDLYISIISDSSGNESWTRRATRDLVVMWEERSNAEAIAFAPLLQQLWDVRHSLVPTVGTLMGTVELLKLSFRLPDAWHDFLDLAGGLQEVQWALDEFLFSLSYEQISNLKEIMHMEGLSSVSRTDAIRRLKLRPSQLLEGRDDDDLSAIKLYRSFLRRNGLARLRRDGDRIGPHRTLEQLLLLHLWNQDE
jgi:hypothetical protein